MSLYSLKGRKDDLFYPIAALAHEKGLTPNIVTAIGLCFGIASGALIGFQVLPAGILCFGISAFCDLLDGTMARKFNQTTSFGLFFDSLSDRLSEISFILGAFASGIINMVGLIAIVGSFALLFLRTVSYMKSMNTDFAFFGRFERLLFIFLGLISPHVTLSTFCFVIAGGVGLVSSVQILISISRRSAQIIRS